MKKIWCFNIAVVVMIFSCIKEKCQECRCLEIPTVETELLFGNDSLKIIKVYLSNDTLAYVNTPINSFRIKPIFKNESNNKILMVTENESFAVDTIVYFPKKQEVQYSITVPNPEKGDMTFKSLIYVDGIK